MLNMGGKVSEREYIEGVVKGCLDSGIYPMVGDTAVDLCLATNLEVIEEYNGQGIIFIKPWKNEVVIEKNKNGRKSRSLCCRRGYRCSWTYNFSYEWKTS